MRSWGAVLVILMAVLGGVSSALAQSGPENQSDIDPNIFRINEKVYLGVKFDADFTMIDQNGSRLKLGSLLGKPLVVVLSYYQCDGTCSLVNRDLRTLLGDVKREQIGTDYRILTLTFDKKDTLTTLAKFRDGLKLPKEWLADWTFALPENEEALRRLTDRIGYKYFWSPQDMTFFHPGVYVILSGEGRVVRFLYSTSTTARDLELALIDAQAGQVSAAKDFANYAVSLCYSYNYKAGRYTINIPLFVGMGSFAFGILVLTLSVVGYRWYKRKERTA